jgi:hypothetical protein
LAVFFTGALAAVFFAADLVSGLAVFFAIFFAAMILGCLFVFYPAGEMPRPNINLRDSDCQPL